MAETTDIAAHPVTVAETPVLEVGTAGEAMKEAVEVVKTEAAPVVEVVETKVEEVAAVVEEAKEVKEAVTEAAATSEATPVETPKETPRKVRLWRRVYEGLKAKMRRANKTVGPAETSPGPSVDPSSSEPIKDTAEVEPAAKEKTPETKEETKEAPKEEKGTPTAVLTEDSPAPVPAV